MGKLIEVIGIREDNCINCHQCIAVCPVKVCSDGSGDVVKFNNQLCIGCGRCIDACIKSHGGAAEKSARIPIDDSREFINDLNNKNIAALVAPSAQCNFELKKLIKALKTLGLKAVYDVSLGAEMTVACYHQIIESGQAKLPLISQSCPAIVKYIELYQPDLLQHLAPSGSPVYDIAVYVHSLHPDCELAFISPCLAKRREFQDSKLIRYNLIFSSLLHILGQKQIKLDAMEEADFDNPVSAGIAANFSKPGGLKECYLHNYPGTPPRFISKIEGPLAFEKYLPDLETAIKNRNSHLPMIVDILSCENGCNTGPGCINHDKSLDMIEQKIAARSEIAATDQELQQKLQDFLKDILGKYDFSYRCYENLSSNNTVKVPSQEELQAIYQAMHKKGEKDFRNCAACGYNSCHNMAVAIFNGLNKGENCHLYQEKELLLEHEILNDMVAELEALNTQLEEEFRERKQQEQLLIQNSKLAAMGEMIGMIAHQWRQPLSSISTLAANLQVFLELEMFERDQFMNLLKEINDHAQYLSATINDFRHFFRPDNPQDMVLLSKVLEDALGIIGKSLEYNNVTLKKLYSFTTPILTYPNELMQVFLNILKNAGDAFADNQIQKPLIFIRGCEQNDHYLIEFEDNAGGIPEEILDKIFDPYFSTKGFGVGTGLGLYMSKMIVEEHCQGELKASNTEQGACFTIKLPLAQGEIE